MDDTTLQNLIGFLSPFLENEASLQYFIERNRLVEQFGSTAVERERNGLVEQFGSAAVERAEFIYFNLLPKTISQSAFEDLLNLIERYGESYRKHVMKSKLSELLKGNELDATSELVQFIQENQEIICRFIESNKTISNEDEESDIINMEAGSVGAIIIDHF